MRYPVAIGLLAVVAACGSNNQEIQQLKESQRQLQAKVAELEKKVDQGRPAPQMRPTVDPNKVYDIPAADSPFKGPATARVMLVEFSDFQ